MKSYFAPTLTTIVIWLMFLTALASCKGGWTKEDRDLYLQSCRQRGDAPATGAEAYCQCRLEQTMKVYPAINDMLDHFDSSRLRSALLQCDQQPAGQ